MTAVDPATKQAAINTWLAGDISILATARQHGLNPSTVHRWVATLRRKHPELRSPDNPRDNGAPPIYTGGWVLRGGVRRPRINIRAATAPDTTPTRHHHTKQEASTAA